MPVQTMAPAAMTDEPVPPTSRVVHVIRSEAGPPLGTAEGDQLSASVELKQPRSIRYVEPIESMKGYAWLAGSLVHWEQPLFLKATALPPSPHSIGTVPLVEPDVYAA